MRKYIDGTDGNDTIIDPVDAAAANLVTVGTIGTGVWEGTTVAVDQGGTGLTSASSSGFIPVSNGSGFVMQAIDGGTYS